MADGQIIIDTYLNRDGFTKGIDDVVKESKSAANAIDKSLGKGISVADLERSCKEAIKTISALGEKTQISAEKATNAFLKQARAVQDLEVALKAKEQQIAEEKKYLDILEEQYQYYQRLNQSGVDDDGRQLSQEEYLENRRLLTEVLEEQRAKEKELAADESKLSGMQMKHNQAVSDLDLQYRSLNATMVDYARKAAEATAETERQTSATRLSSMLSGENAFSGINSKITELTGNLLKATGATKKLNTGFNMNLKTILKYGLGIRSTFVLFNKLRHAIVSGMQALAQYSNETNTSISSLVSSLNYVKYSLAAAFAPILNVIAPVLTKLIDMLATAISYINAFFAALSGATTFTKAKKVQTDYAKSLGGAGSAAKKAADATEDLADATERYLSPLDTINKMDSNSAADKSPVGGGGGGGGGVGDMFETAEIPKQANELAEAFKKLFEPLKAAWENEGENTINSAKYALESLKTLAADVGRSLAEVWTNGTGQQAAETILRIVQDIFTYIGNIATQLDVAWKTNEVGTRLIQNIANCFQSVLDFVERIAKATSDWAKNLDFYPLLKSIADLFGAISPLIDAIGGVLGNYYDTIILPLFKKLIEDWLPKLIEFVSGFFDFLSQHTWILELVGALLIGAFSSSLIVPAIGGIIGAVGGFIGVIGKLVEAISGGGGLLGALGLIGKALGGGGLIQLAVLGVIALLVLLVTHWDKVKETMQKVGDWLKVTFKGVWESVHKGMYDKSNGFFGQLGQIWDGIKKIFKGIGEFLTGAFTYDWDTAWNGIKDIIDGVFTAVSGIVKGAVNEVIKAINGMISGVASGLNAVIGALNGISVSIPAWVPKYGGQTFGINIPTISAPQIPYLASGAVIPPNAPFTAVLGDQRNGNNIETPERLLRQIVKEEAGKNGNYRFTATINRRVLFDEMITEAKLRQQSSGRNPMLLGG